MRDHGQIHEDTLGALTNLKVSVENLMEVVKMQGQRIKWLESSRDDDERLAMRERDESWGIQ